MSHTKVAVFGGTGQTGRAVVAGLRARGAVGVPLSRTDLASRHDKLAGCDVAYLIAPNMHPDEPALVASFIDIAVRAGVQRLVYHSVVAPHAPAMQHHMGKAFSEDIVRRSSLGWTILQPCAYIQNFLPGVPEDEIRVPFRTDAPFGLVDLDDVGSAAAAVCDQGGHVGATYELGGPATVTVADLASVATRLSGKSVRAVAESIEDWAMRAGAGMSPDVRKKFVDMWNYYDSYGLLTGPAPLRAILGRPARSIEDALADALPI